MRVLILSLLVIAMGCSKGPGTCLTSAGSDRTEVRVLPAFHSLDISKNIEIEFYPNSAENKAEITGGDNLLEGCITEVKDGVLTITNKNRCNWLRDYKKKIKMKLYGNTIRTLTYYGSAPFVMADTMTTDHFTFLGWESSGDIKLLLNTKETFIKQNTGTTDVTVFGQSEFVYYYSLTTGYIYGRDFACKDGYVSQLGYGDFYINPSNSLAGEVRKSGNVYYPGGIPQTVEVSGSGKLLKF